MQWEFIIALLVAIPVILFPAAFVWYLHIGGIYHAIQEARLKRKAAKERRKVVAEAEQHIARASAKEQHTGNNLVGTKR